MTRIGYVGRGLFSAALMFLSACSTQLSKPDPLGLPPAATIESPILGTNAKPAQTAVPEGQLHVWTLPVGAGNCQVVNCPSRDTAGFRRLLLMDCGALPSGKNPNFQAPQVRDFLNTMVDAKTQVVVTVSHPDQDHYNYIGDVFGNYQVAAIYLALNRSDYSVGNFAQWLHDQEGGGAHVIEKNGPYATPAGIDPYLSCPKADGKGGNYAQVESRILAMNASGSGGTVPNNASMVVSMKFGAFQTLFTGDMTKVTEALVDNLSAGWDLKSQVVTGAHHGANTDGSNALSWAQKTSPQAVVFSSGTLFKHPRCESVGNYWAYGIRGAAPTHFSGCQQSIPLQTTLPVFVTQINGIIHYWGYENGTFDVEHQ